eukprot:3485922-Rhodomonas_salina.1
MQRLRSQIQGATDALLEAQLKQAEAHSSRTMTLKPGDQALVSTKHLNLTYPTKLTPKYLGQFKVLEIMPSGNAAKLELQATMRRLDPTFSFDCLCPYHTRDSDLLPSAPPPPPPAFVNAHGNPLYFVQLIIAERPYTYKGQKTVKYLVQYVCYGPADDTWCEHPWFSKEPAGEVAITAWLACNTAIPGPVTRDRAGRHHNKSSTAQQVSQLWVSW